MVDLELHMEDDVTSHINLDGFFGDLPEAGDVIKRHHRRLLLDERLTASLATSLRPATSSSDIIGACSSTNVSSSSPDSRLLWFDEIENILMKDIEDVGVVGGGIRADLSRDFCDRFFANVLVDSPRDGSAEIAGRSGDKEEPGSSDDGWVKVAKVDGANGGGETYDLALRSS